MSEECKDYSTAAHLHVNSSRNHYRWNKQNLLPTSSVGPARARRERASRVRNAPITRSKRRRTQVWTGGPHMRSALLVAATILVASTASAWSQEARSSPRALVQAPGELESDAADVESTGAENPPRPVPEDGTTPSLGDDSSYLNSNSRWLLLPY